MYDKDEMARLIKDPVRRAQYLLDRQRIENNCARNVAITQAVFFVIIVIAVVWTMVERYIGGQ